MAQGIRPMNVSVPYAQEAMPMSMAKRGNQAMNLPNPGVKNAMDGGDVSKVNMNPQFQVNAGLNMQNMQQNMQTQGFQQQVAAKGAMKAASAAADNAQSRAQQAMNASIANVMLAMPTGGESMMRFQNIMSDPQGGKKLLNDVAISSAMYQKSMA